MPMEVVGLDHRNGYGKREHAFQKIIKDLQKEALSGPVLLHGVESYLVSWARTQIINAYVPAASRPLDLAEFTPDHVDVNAVIASCETPPVLAQRKVVVLDDFSLLYGGRQAGFEEKDKESLKNYFSHVPSFTILLICAPEPADARVKRKGTPLSRALAKAGRVYDFTQLEKRQLLGFVKKRLVSMGKTASRHTMDKLIEESGYYNAEIDYGLYHLMGDLQKIGAYAGQQQITDDDVDQCLSDNLEHNVFRMLDCISTNRKEEAVRLLHDLIRSGTSEYKLLVQIESQFDLMLAVQTMRQEGMSRHAMAKELGGMHEYRIQKLVSACGGSSIGQLAAMYRKAVEAERRIKSGRLAPTFALELMIAEL
jgi:DNA polymerase-3 subunit delta